MPKITGVWHRHTSDLLVLKQLFGSQSEMGKILFKTPTMHSVNTHFLKPPSNFPLTFDLKKRRRKKLWKGLTECTSGLYCSWSRMALPAEKTVEKKKKLNEKSKYVSFKEEVKKTLSSKSSLASHNNGFWINALLGLSLESVLWSLLSCPRWVKNIALWTSLCCQRGLMELTGESLLLIVNK